MLIAVPSEAPGGLASPISDHFGHCAAFTLVEITDGKVGQVKTIANGEHQEGGCMAPVMVLKELDVQVVLAGGMGGRPLAGFQHVGIAVHAKGEASTVGEAVDLFLEGKSATFGQASTCAGGCGDHGHEHGHAPVVRPPIEGLADVRAGRVVSMSYELRDEQGRLLDASESSGEMRLVQGARNLAGLEDAILGHVAGDRVTVSLTPSEGFGERDEERVFEVPRDRLAEDVEVGDVVMADHRQGHQVRFMVREVKDGTVVLDANHPLAGRSLFFDVTILRVESATPEEIEHGIAS